VLAAIEAIRFDYGRHARAARAIADEHLDSRVVLTRLLREIGAVPSATARSVHDASDAELASLLGVAPDALRRRPFEYRSSAPLVELEIDGRSVLVKDLSPEALTERSQAAKVGFLHDPLREIEVYGTLLNGLGTPALVAADRERHWLVVEKVAGTPLYQVELERWHEVARWLARLHDRFAVLSDQEHLVRYDRSYFELWPERADVRPPGYDAVIDRLAALPTTLVHGELYASNVLLAGARVCVVDWELAGVGPGVLDLAALTAGLADEDAAALAETYRLALDDPPDAKELGFELDCARLHLAIQWLGWSPDWTPPPEHALDWRAELPRLVERVGL
jgi:Phosphotransferase enzyme family